MKITSSGNCEVVAQKVILGKDHAPTIQNVLFLLLKSYLYYQTMIKKTIPNFKGHLSHVEYCQKLENSIHCNNNELPFY